MYIYIYISTYAHRPNIWKKTKKCHITPWQEKNKNPHSDLKQFKIKPPRLINF